MDQSLRSTDGGRTAGPAPRGWVATFCKGCLSTLGRLVAYTSATIIGLGLIPVLITLADRGTFLRWSNDVLDLLNR